jgi:hypothetical protein
LDRDQKHIEKLDPDEIPAKKKLSTGTVPFKNVFENLSVILRVSNPQHNWNQLLIRKRLRCP